MRRVLVPFESSGSNGPGKNGLSKGNAAKCRRIKATERMERIAFDRRALDCLVQKPEIKSGVVTNEYCSLASILANHGSNCAKNAL